MGKNGLGRKLGRATAHRWSMLRTMVSQLITHERIETTVQKAKEVRKIADHMVTLGKDGSLAARRRAAAVVRGEGTLQKLFGEFAQRYAARAGGYTRVLQTRRRVGDAAHMAYIEYIDRPGEMRPAVPPNPIDIEVQAWAREHRARFTRGGLLNLAAREAAAAAAAAPAKPAKAAKAAAAASPPAAPAAPDAKA